MGTDRESGCLVPTKQVSRGDGLTEFQIEVAKLFFMLPASVGFLLAGGAALLAQHMISRSTQDLDFFTSRDQGQVSMASSAFEMAAANRGWRVTRIRDTPSFVRLLVAGPEELVVDIALDSPPERPANISIAGPTFHPEELAGRKVIALYDRAEARDFADVFDLARRYGTRLLLERAAEVDPGFDRRVFVDMLRSLARFTDDELPVPADEVAALRAFFADWANEVQSR
jgi:Nucleotidyl transferase AbiEii toxin, Type IV TA system